MKMSLLWGLSEDSDYDSPDASEEEIEVLLMLNDIFTILSLVAGVFIIILFIKTWSTCTHLGKMSFYLNLANLFYTITNILPIFHKDYYMLCNVDGFLRTFATLSCMIWSTKIALTAFRTVIAEQTFTKGQISLKLGFLFPAIISLFPLLPQQKYIFYENVGLSCDVFSIYYELQIAWPLLLGILPICISVILTMYSYGKIITFLKGLGDEYDPEVKRFLAYPVSLVIIWLPLAIFKFMYFADDYVVWLDGASIVFSRSSGFINAIIYGWEKIKFPANDQNPEFTEYDSEEETDESFIDGENKENINEVSYYTMEKNAIRRSSIMKL